MNDIYIFPTENCFPQIFRHNENVEINQIKIANLWSYSLQCNGVGRVAYMFHQYKIVKIGKFTKIIIILMLRNGSWFRFSM